MIKELEKQIELLNKYLGSYKKLRDDGDYSQLSNEVDLVNKIFGLKERVFYLREVNVIDNIILKRLRFNKAFNLPVSEKPTSISLDRAELQFDMMKEELEEYQLAQSREKKSITEIADSLIDMQEILLGMFAEHGMIFKLEELYNEVHRSNMSKLDNNGKPLINGKNGVFDETRPLGKVIKSKNFSEPNFTEILK
ncbi:hypothetical protein [Polaribacter sp.]|uniref:hypothetical protein n=1 Tax=Polaribacter sp. TaxID=1920175 RepID=UPI003F6AFB74